MKTSHHTIQQITADDAEESQALPWSTLSTKCEDLRFKRNSSSLDEGSRTSYEQRKKAKVSLPVTHPYDSTPEAEVTLEICVKLVLDIYLLKNPFSNVVEVAGYSAVTPKLKGFV